MSDITVQTIQPKATPAKDAAKGTLKIIAFCVNFFLPGVGTLIMGRIGTGIVQMVLMFVGILTIGIGVGFFIMLGTWIWGMVTVLQGKPKQQIVVVQQMTCRPGRPASRTQSAGGVSSGDRVQPNPCT